jgi:hypothetical protein
MNTYRALITAMLAAAALGSTTAQAAAPLGSSSAAVARTTVAEFFAALESHRYRKACGLLGSALLVETGGANCPSFLRFGTPEPLRWTIVRARPAGAGVGIVVRLGQNELEHVRMRTWLAIVRYEHGSPKIVETRLLD